MLGCKVFEHYGSREFAMIAGECERHQGLHVNTAAAYVEFLPVQGADVEGLQELLVTDLLNYGMPLIRYKVNDCTILGQSECPCGRGFPLLRQITGRMTDVFHLPNGDIVPGVALTNRVLKVCPGLKKVQVIQEAMDHFVVCYVPGTAFGQTDLDSLTANLRRFLSEDVKWTFERVTDIQRERSGKTRFCISKVGRPVVHHGSVGGP
jgi:phenylacetate-CoA ligase